MARVILPAGFAKAQPLTPVRINWDNPLARGVVNALVGGLPWDVVSGVPLTRTSGILREVAPVGLVLNGQLTAPRFNSVTTPGDISGDFTLLAIASRDRVLDFAQDWTIGSIATNRVSASGWEVNFGNAFGPAIDVDKPRADPGTGSVVVWMDGAKVSGTNPAAFSTVTGQMHTMVCQFTGAASDGGSGVRWMANGAPGGAFTLPGRLALGLLWKRLLTDAEVAAISANPWQLFTPSVRPLIIAPGATVTIVSAAASSTSTATDIAVGAAKATADFSSTGTATDIGVGNAIAAAAFSSTATATATGDARSTASAAATSTGVATDIAVGAALSSGAMTSASVLTATGSPPGAIIVAGDGSSVSASTAAATGASTASSAATSASVATPIAVGASLVAGAGRSVSTGTFTASSVTSSARRVYGGRKRDEQRRRQNNQLMQLVAIAVPLISREGSWAH